jgi:hypothetical protein
VAACSARPVRTGREDERFRLASDSEHWCALCFASREKKDTILARAGLLHVGDKYLDGRAVAALMGVDMPNTATGGERS